MCDGNCCFVLRSSFGVYVYAYFAPTLAFKNLFISIFSCTKKINESFFEIKWPFQFISFK